MNRVVPLAVLAALLMVLVPDASVAQDAELRPMYELPTITVLAPIEGDPLYDQVMSLYEQARWEDAAELHRSAAESMPENDANAYFEYDRAARLYFYAGEYSEAREMMENAASIAEATGDMESAAYRHIDAAFIAVWEGYPGKRREHVEIAERYAN
jgi:tetratricopeptide (TPR) repeat protein